MPSAGAVVPPVITALKRSQPGHPNTHIDTTTFIQLETETSGSKIFFSTNGDKPNPFQMKVAGREITFKYRGPFTLKPGKRMVKAIAIARDGLQESNVVCKQFVVDDVGDPDQDDLEFLETDLDTRRSNTNGSSKQHKPRPSRGSANFSRSKRPIFTRNGNTKSAWESGTESPKESVHDSMNMPGNINVFPAQQRGIPNYYDGQPEGDGQNQGPTNYSGTQVNMYGVHPAMVPGLMSGNVNPAMFTGGGVTYPDKHKQLGYLTDQMIKSTEQPRLTVGEVKQLLENQKPATPPALPPPQPITLTEPEFNEQSPGNGDWKGNLEHIYAHLIDRCKKNTQFRNAIGQPQIGFITDGECQDDDGKLNLNITFTFEGTANKKPKPRKKVEAKVVTMTKKRPTPPPTPPPVKLAEPPKPKPKKAPNPTKPPPPPPEEPFFQTEEYQADGTLKEWEYFDTELDCELLKKAMSGLGTDETAITNVMGYRCCTQRVENNKMYKTMFGKNLREELMSETSGNYKELLAALCMGAADYDASEINRAVKGLGTDEDVLIEVLCTRTNVQIKEIAEAYKKLYPKKDMIKDVKDDTSGNFRKVLEYQMNGNRNESKEYDLTAAKSDAQALYNAGEKQWGTDESQFNQILCQRSFAHLRAVFNEYDKVSGKKTIEQAIKSEFSGDIKDSLLTLVSVIRDKPLYFAKLMQKSMKGLGTDDSALIRAVVSRCECDMVQIMAAFEKEFGKPLAQWIKEDCSGDYSELLLALIGDRPPPAPTSEEVEAAQEPKEIEEMEEEKIEEKGTVMDASPFDPKKDCEVLKKAMKGFGTDEDAIISVWPHRSNKQRQEIITTYRTMYNKDLIKELVSEISGNFEDVVVAMGQKPADYDANELRKAMKGLGTDEDCLIEILCTRNNAEMAALQEAYTRLHKRKLEDDIISETSGNLKNLLVSMVQANRMEGNMIDRAKARRDAKALLEAGEEKFGTDESRFNVILCSRSFAHLRAMFQEYAKISEKDIEDVIKSEMSGDIKKGMLTVVRCVKNKRQQFAKRLHDAMSGLGTDDDSLIRVCVSRSEIDMVQIKEQFQQLYDQSLGQFIKDDISGDYRKTVLTLVGETGLIKK